MSYCGSTLICHGSLWNLHENFNGGHRRHQDTVSDKPAGMGALLHVVAGAVFALNRVGAWGVLFAWALFGFGLGKRVDCRRDGYVTSMLLAHVLSRASVYIHTCSRYLPVCRYQTLLSNHSARFVKRFGYPIRSAALLALLIYYDIPPSSDDKRQTTKSVLTVWQQQWFQIGSPIHYVKVELLFHLYYDLIHTVSLTRLMIGVNGHSILCTMNET